MQKQDWPPKLPLLLYHNAMLSVVAFIVTIGLLVTIHEYGHFIVARFFDVKVIKFSIGFGKPLYKKVFGKDKSELIIAAIPLGGYVQMLDENNMDEDEKQKASLSEIDLSRAFNRQSVYKRIAIVLAGPISNLLLAILIYWGMIYSGVTSLAPYVGELKADTPAAIAGIQKGDLITQINQNEVQSWQDIRWHIVQEAADKSPLTLSLKSAQGATRTLVLPLITLDSEKMDQDPLLQLGLTFYNPELPAIIGEIAPDAPASRAGLQKGDEILSLDNESVAHWADFVQRVQASADKTLTVLISRDGVRQQLSLTPAAQSQQGKTVGKIGAGVDYPASIKEKYWVTSQYSIIESLSKATSKTFETAWFSLKMLGAMFKGDISWKMMSGPVTIADYAGQSASMGFKAFFGFLALISISIGVLNLLPIPMLDGGHFMYYVIEILLGRPVPESVMMVGQRIGIALIGMMMMLAFYNDFNRLVSG